MKLRKLAEAAVSRILIGKESAEYTSQGLLHVHFSSYAIQGDRPQFHNFLLLWSNSIVDFVIYIVERCVRCEKKAKEKCAATRSGQKKKL